MTTMTTMTTLSTAAPISKLMSSMSFLGALFRISPYAIAGVWGQPPPSQLPSAGRQPANGEASGLPEAMLAFTKYPPCEAPERTAVFTRFSEQFFGNGFLYCAKTFKKLLLKKYIAERKMRLPCRRKHPCILAICVVIYI